MIPAFRLSMLKAQRELLGDAFVERHPHPWLVWEVATGEPSRSSPQSLVSTVPNPDSPRPAEDDPVCFELQGESIGMGRTPDNDLVLLDAAVSRHHLELRQVGANYAAVLPSGEKSVQVGESPLAPGLARPLASGDRLRLGGNRLVYLGPFDLVVRVDGTK